MTLEVRVDKSMKILVVDDFPPMRRIITKLLSDLGFTDIEEADDGLTALPMLMTGKFDFLVTDWNMPGMEGIELLKAVRGEPSIAALPTLMVTTEARREQILLAAEAGVDGYVVKPFTAQILQQKIDEIFERLQAA